MDLYPIPSAIYSLLFIFSLIYLKFTIREITVNQYRQIKEKTKVNFPKDHQQSIQNNHNIAKKGNLCHNLKILIRNFTIAQIFIRKAPRRVSLLLFGHASIGLYIYFMGFSQYWALSLSFNAVISFGIIILQYCQQKQVIKTQEHNLKRWRFAKYLYIFIGIVTMSSYLWLFRLCFKNYQNNLLQNMLIKLGTVFLADNLGIKPFFLLIMAYSTQKSQVVDHLINRYQRQQEKNLARIANEDNISKVLQSGQCRIQLKVRPYHIDPIKIKKKSLQKNILLTNLNLIETIQNQQEISAQNIFNDQEKKIYTQNDLFQLDRTQEHANIEIKKHFCINLRKENKTQALKSYEMKLSKSIQHKHKTEDIFNIQKSQTNDNKDGKEDVFGSKQSFRSRIKRNSYYKSKDSLRGVNSIKIIDKDMHSQTIQDFHDKENLNIQAIKEEITVSGRIHKEKSATSKGKSQHRNVLKINEYFEDIRELQEINLDQTPHHRNFNTTCYQTHVIPEEQLKQRNKRQRRKTAKQETILPFNDKLIAIYHPESTKSQRDSIFRALRKNFGKSQLILNEKKKSKSISIGRDRPIVHQKQNQITEFYLPKLNQK